MSDPPCTFDFPGVDVILRAPLHPDDPESTEFKDFHTQKVILSTASTVFHDMFSVPQPQPAEIFEILLRLIYPTEPPVIDTFRIVGHLLQLARKYMANGIHTRLRRILVSPPFLRDSPIWVYAIARCMDLDEEAQLAIPHTYQIDLIREIPPPLLEAMTTKMYNRLLRSHTARREELASIIDQTKCPPREGKCACGLGSYANLRKEISLAIWERPILDRRRLDSCLPGSNGPKSACALGSSCRLSARMVSSYFTSILDGIEKLAPVPDD